MMAAAKLMKSALRVALVLSSLTLAAPAWSLDLLQVYQLALEQDSTLRAARATADAMREQLPQAQAQLRPNVAFSAGRTHNDLTSTQSQSYFSNNQSLILRQPLYRKPLFAALEQAGHAVDDADAVLERELQNLGVRVAGAYLEALLAQDQATLVQAQKASITIQLDAARKALAAGSGIRTDIDEAQARLDWVLAQELEAAQQVQLSRRQIEVLVNQPVAELAPLDAAKLPLLAPLPAKVQDWIELASNSSPEILALQARLEVARLEVNKAQGAYYPTLDAVVQITRSANENVTTPSSSYNNKSIGLQLNVPLYAGGYTNSVVRQALAGQTRARELLEATRRDLGVRVHREFRGVTEGILRIQAREQALRSVTQLVISSQRSVAAGSRTVLDVLNAQDRQQQALRDLAQARYEYVLSRVRLQALVGGDKLQSIGEVNGWLKSAQ